MVDRWCTRDARWTDGGLAGLSADVSCREKRRPPSRKDRASGITRYRMTWVLVSNVAEEVVFALVLLPTLGIVT